MIPLSKFIPLLGLAAAIELSACSGPGSALRSEAGFNGPSDKDVIVSAPTDSDRVEVSKKPSNTGRKVPTLLETLLANGALTPEQFRELEQAADDTDHEEDDPQITIGSSGFRVTSADGQSNIKIGGRIQADANLHTNDGNLDGMINDGTELRRARFELKGKLPDNLLWAAEVDFANNGTSIKDFWVGWDNGDSPTYTFGHQKQPYSLDVEMSSNDIPFVERGVDTFLVIPFVDRAIGARAQNNTDNVFWAAGVYGDSVSPVAADDEGWGATGRLVAAPIQTDTQVFHAGIRGSYRNPKDPIRIRDESSNMSNLRVVDTGVLMDVDSVSLVGVETAYVAGPWAVGGEWNAVNVRLPGNDPSFTSFHVQTTYSITGESRAAAYRMDAGEFKRLRREKEGERPLEFAARFANIDLNSKSLMGGEEDVLSVGLNWYYSPNLRLMFNWSHVLDTDGGSATTAAAEGVNLFTFRTQLNF